MEGIRIKVAPKKQKINRLFIVGNGLDISLGLKTRYTDFLLWLLKRETLKAINSGIFEAPFEKHKGVYDSNRQLYHTLKIKGYAENELFDILIENSGHTHSIKILEEIKSLKAFHDYVYQFKINIKPFENSILMPELLINSKDNWVDIENIYFRLLKEIIVDENSTSTTTSKNKLKKHKERIFTINSELSAITGFLKEYLATLSLEIDSEHAKSYLKHFDKNLHRNDFIEFSDTENITIGLNYFLNFNYTDSITKLLHHLPTYDYQQNFIHGSLTTDEIIFGFGDEMDKVYKEIEELNDNSFFKHIKSFHYFKSPNQRELQRFLNSGLYQVCIYGHSCGLSDRVMLNEIFEHDNCKSIKIYYYSDDDFVNKTMEISRHFNSNQDMRKKIVDKSKDCLIPQIKDIG